MVVKNYTINNMIARLQAKAFIGGQLTSQAVRNIRMLEGRQFRKLRKYLNDTHLDFTLSSPAKQFIKRVDKSTRERAEFVPLSEALSQTKIPKVLPPYVELRKDQKRRLSRLIKKRLTEGITAAERQHRQSLKDKIFYLDQTAAVLENYRRILEVKTFNKLLHREREKKLFLKMHSRKLENLIPDFDIRFKTFERWNNTDLLLEEPQHLPRTFLEDPQTSGKIESKYQKYLDSKKTLANIRIEQFLTDRPRNPKLLQLSSGASDTEHDNTVITIENGETSLVPQGVIAPTESNYQEDLAKQLKLANEISTYEDKVVKHYDKNYDLYKSYSKKGRPHFAILSKGQLLNYVKFNLKSMNDAFFMYQETKKLPDSPFVTAGLLQKLSLAIVKKDMKKLVECKTFREMFRDARDCATKLDNKSLVDTLFAVTLIYHNKNKAMETMPKFLWHFSCTYLEEIKNRIPSLNENHIAFVCRALNRLKSAYGLIPLIDGFNEKMFERALSCVPSMKSYTIAPILSYIVQNGFYESAKKLVTSLINTLVNPSAAPEPYIYPNDLVTCIIAISKIPENTELVKVSLEKLKETALTELPDLTFTHVSNILRSYTIKHLWHKDLFDQGYNHVCKIFQLQGEPITFDHFTSILWSVSEYFTRNQYYSLNYELGAFMNPTTEYKLGQYKARILDSLMSYVERLKVTGKNLKWWPRVIYAMGVLNYKNHKEITEYGLSIIKENIEMLEIADWGFILHGLMLLKCPTKEIFTMAIESIKEGKKNEINSLLKSFVAIGQTGLLPELLKEDEKFAEKFFWVQEQLANTEENFNKSESIAALLWCLKCADRVEGISELVPLLDTTKIQPHISALLSQALNGLTVKAHLVAQANAKALVYEREYMEQCLENMQSKCGKDLEKEMRKTLKKDKAYYKSMEFVERGTVAGCYIAPLVSEKHKVCIVFEFESDFLLDASTSNNI
eukprot:TRINITY_DN1338_c0_g1_i1.p1 TRINITY_DN1338_c0_g1~~TRINITY_DN1338_c0_g1_i1.p1  ORF type:complete len:960 (+),score=110.14 TRINITY_DN1338_c0_g1_i1:2172-5051(+)